MLNGKPGDLKMIGSTSTAGGVFRNIGITGETVLTGDVDCIRFACTGQSKVQGGLRANELRLTGEITVQGRLDAGKIKGRGELEVDQGMRGENVAFTGNIEIKGDCESGTFALDGAFSVEGLLSAERLEIKMYGPCRVRELGGGTLRVKRSSATKLLGIIKSKQSAQLHADLIEGDTIELEHTRAGIVRGNRIKLGPGCEIGRVEYVESLNKHKSAVLKETVRLS